MERLPREIVFKRIAPYLVGREDGASLRATSSTFVELGEADVLWRRAVTVTPPRETKGKTFYEVLGRRAVDDDGEDADLGNYWARKVETTRRARRARYECFGSCWQFLDTFARRDLFDKCRSLVAADDDHRDDDNVRFVVAPPLPLGTTAAARPPREDDDDDDDVEKERRSLR
mmetsp:Transcript_24892/g.80528  ORF Transcript_24892/g.80528 Transcript_24892/m.80528 type:complete len:173 (+) Transcript_24892:1906-2424(+)